MKKNDRQDWETNRHMSQRPHKTKFWCWGCDRYLVALGQKCPVCGHRNETKRFKK